MANAARKPKTPDVVKFGIIRDHSKHPDGDNHNLTKAMGKFANMSAFIDRREARTMFYNGAFKQVFNYDNFVMGLLMLHAANRRASYLLGLFIAQQVLPLCQNRTVHRTLEADPRAQQLFEDCKDYINNGKWTDIHKTADLYLILQNSHNNPPQVYNRYAVGPLLALASGVSSNTFQAIYWYRPLSALEAAIMAQPDKAAIDSLIEKVYDRFISLLEDLQNDRPLEYDD